MRICSDELIHCSKFRLHQLVAVIVDKEKFRIQSMNHFSDFTIQKQNSTSNELIATIFSEIPWVTTLFAMTHNLQYFFKSLILIYLTFFGFTLLTY